jgi:LDH2 family malate/lactate/ureidoglycolate dehydrogenase
LWVDIFCGILSGAAYADLVYPKTPDGKPLPSNIGHFFGAWRIDGFRPIDEFKAAMDDLQKRLKNAPKAENENRIYVHGEKESEEAARRSKEGIPLNAKVAADLRAIAAEFGVEYKLE